jgi:hypothetical protein
MRDFISHTSQMIARISIVSIYLATVKHVHPSQSCSKVPTKPVHSVWKLPWKSTIKICAAVSQPGTLYFCIGICR